VFGTQWPEGRVRHGMPLLPDTAPDSGPQQLHLFPGRSAPFRDQTVSSSVPPLRVAQVGLPALRSMAPASASTDFSRSAFPLC
jgi:hypothetical protein